MTRGTACAGALALFAVSAGAVPPPQEDYLLHCSGCHVRDGSGSAEGRIPRLEGQIGHFMKLPEGRRFVVQVPGVMNSGLGNEDVEALMNWMIPHFAGASLDREFVPYSAGEIAAALGAESLVFLTDVPGVLIADRSTVARMTPEQAGEMISSGVVVGGMIPKVEAAIRAARAGCATRIIDGTAAGALAAVLTGLGGGTTITP